jgi:hypothetical protein
MAGMDTNPDKVPDEGEFETSLHRRRRRELWEDRLFFLLLAFSVWTWWQVGGWDQMSRFEKSLLAGSSVGFGVCLIRWEAKRSFAKQQRRAEREKNESPDSQSD